MSLNPYESPVALESALEPYRVPVALQIPAIGLLGLGALSCLPAVFGPIFLVLALTLEDGPSFSSFEVLQVLGSYASIFIAYGAFQMRRLRRYRLCCWTAGLACVPFFSPMIWLGIPFGVWALVVLRRPSVRALFAD